MSVLASDNFNRADENPLGNSVWATQSGQTPWQVASNVATPTDLSGTDDVSLYTGIAWPNDQYSEAQLTVNSTTGGGQGVGLAVRGAAGAITGYSLIADHAASNNVALFKHNAGTPTTLITITQAWTDGATWRLEVQGTTLRGFLNGVQVITATDGVVTSGSPGVWLSTAVISASIDNFVGGDFAASIGGGLPDNKIYRTQPYGAGGGYA